MGSKLLQQGRDVHQDADDTSNEAYTANAPMATRFDESTASISYVGRALPGVATSGAGWQIKRMTTSGADINIEFALLSINTWKYRICRWRW